jgi:hypothetical protein
VFHCYSTKYRTNCVKKYRIMQCGGKSYYFRVVRSIFMRDNLLFWSTSLPNLLLKEHSNIKGAFDKVVDPNISFSIIRDDVRHIISIEKIIYHQPK